MMKPRTLVPLLVVAAAVVGLAVRGQDTPRAPATSLSPVSRAIARAAPSVVRVELSAGTPLTRGSSGPLPARELCK